MPGQVHIEALLGRLEQIKMSGERAAKPAAEAMGSVAERAIKQELALTSHAKGTPTPAPRYSPPSLITGQLRRSVRQTKSFPSGNNRWTVHIAPTTVYARIQELGGWAGRGHRSHLPPRPYVRPSVQRNRVKARNAAVRAFRAMTGL